MAMQQTLRAPVSDIQRYCVHDGPGIRTVVFFKGCPLRCQWCQNPETQSARPQLMVTPSLCIGCGACLAACPAGAVSAAQGPSVTDRGRCTACGACAVQCYAGARRVVGEEKTVEEVERAVLADAVFYRNTGGGVTLSGGEAAMYPGFASALLRRLQKAGVHTALETCGHCTWEDLERILAHTDLVLFDIKHTDPEAHRRYTGVGNEKILDNLARACQMGKHVVIRFPFIPGVNDSEENLRETARIAVENGIKEVHLLGFHQLGENKWHGLEMPYACAAYQSPSEQTLAAAAALLRGYGLRVSVGGAGE